MRMHGQVRPDRSLRRLTGKRLFRHLPAVRNAAPSNFPGIDLMLFPATHLASFAPAEGLLHLFRLFQRIHCFMENTTHDIRSRVIRSLVAAVTVSFVALSLGAAFGVLSGRGAFAGMISAALIASITSALGGTRIQCSGPTGPMTTVMVALCAFATGKLSDKFPGVSSDHFINLTLYLMAGLMLLFSVFRLGRFIRLIPNVVISGFMNGIAVIIWVDQAKRLFGLGGKEALSGSTWTNAAVMAITTVLVFLLPRVVRSWVPKYASLLSATFLAIVIMTAACSFAGLDIERVTLATGLKSWDDLTTLVSSQFPADWSMKLLLAAFPFALQLAVLGYLDTLMTALVIDKMTGEITKPNKELFGQGVAHVAVAAVGGIAGAQATIRSVLMVKEGASWRWAGILVGVFALAEILVFQDLIKLIPQAVFAGVLIKVGYDVFDWLPLRIFLKSFAGQAPASLAGTGAAEKSGNGNGNGLRVYPLEMAMIVGTTLVTIFLDLNIAVGVFTGFFYIHNHWLRPGRPIPDLREDLETERFSDED
jgi:sulfate permease, SulP family